MMKRLISGFLLLTALGIFAQEEKPTDRLNLMVGGSGSVGFDMTFSDDESGRYRFSLYPSVGIFLTDGFALGGSPSFGIYGDPGGLLGASSSSISAGFRMFVVEYFNIGIFIKGSFGYEMNRFHSYSGILGEEYTNLTHSVVFVPEVGYAFFLGPNVALELSINNQFTFLPGESSTVSSSTRISAGFQIFL
jgi:hypothetical protein